MVLEDLRARIGGILENKLPASILASLTGQDSLLSSLSVAGI